MGALKSLAAAAALIGATSLLASVPADAGVRTSVTAQVWTEPASGYGFIDSAIEQAHRNIDLSMYELSDPTIESDLVARARAGVDVRVILNSAYDGASENAAAAATLRAGSVHVIWAPSDQIFHAKYLVIDDATAYIGTGNFVPADYASTRDFWVSDSRPSDVSAIVATFGSDYSGGSATHQAGGLVWSPGSTETLVSLIDSARHSVLVENEEMDSSPIESSLMSAAHRGVDVEIAMTEDPDWTSALDRLASNGVHVRLLSESQIYIHAKVICVDCAGDAGTVFLGSENFSTASLSYNRELGVITTTGAAVRAVRQAVEADFAEGAPLRAPTPTPVASGAGVTITSIVASISPGSYETLSAHASRANETCTLSVVLPSGYTSEASGLGQAATSAAGNVTWNWRIGTSTDPGTARATVACASGTTTRNFTIT
ncbi:MAG: phospholipase D-like domain-containing protein [Acidimicrobiales bacterium]